MIAGSPHIIGISPTFKILNNRTVRKWLNLIFLIRRENVSGRDNKSQFSGLLQLRNIGNDLFNKAMVLFN